MPNKEPDFWNSLILGLQITDEDIKVIRNSVMIFIVILAGIYLS
jgi:hypothetical protein